MSVVAHSVVLQQLPVLGCSFDRWGNPFPASSFDGRGFNYFSAGCVMRMTMIVPTMRRIAMGSAISQLRMKPAIT